MLSTEVNGSNVGNALSEIPWERFDSGENILLVLPV